MSISLEALNNLENNSSYYLSDSGEVKKSGILQRLKCFFGVGGGRTRVANLLSEIKKSLISTSDGSGATALNQELNRKSTKSLTGSEIKELVKRFKVQNHTDIAMTSAKKILDNKLNDAIKTSPSEEQNPDKNKKLSADPSALRDFLKKGQRYYLNHLPFNEENTTVTNENGTSENKKYNKLNMQSAEGHFNNDIILRKNVLKEVVKDKNVTYLSPRYLEYINDTLFYKDDINPIYAKDDDGNEDKKNVINGKRNKVPVKDLKTPQEFFRDLVIGKLGDKYKDDQTVQNNITFIFCQRLLILSFFCSLGLYHISSNLLADFAPPLHL